MLTVLRHHDERLPLSSCTLATARSCIAHALACYEPDTAFLPGICPEGLIQPFMQAGIEVALYRLKPDLTVDVDDLSARLHEMSAKRPVVAVVHYCGYESPTRAALLLARRHDGILLEDCAQALLGSASRARNADVAVFSFNKFLPVPDGAIAISRRSDVHLTLDPKDGLPDAALRAYRLHLDANVRLSWSTDIGEAKAIAGESARHYDDYYRHIRDLQPFACRQSSYGAYQSAPLPQCAEKRMHTVAAWPKAMMRHLYRTDALPTFALPIRCFGRRDRIEDALINAGVFPSWWGDKWIEPPKSFEMEREFMDDHLLLPIHEGVSQSDVRAMANVVESVV